MKFQLGTLLIIGSLISISRACAPGCLVCDPSNTSCKVCDFYNGFIPDGNSCVYSAIANCDIQGADGSCLQCKGEYFYISQNRICVPAFLPVKNCRLYSDPATCSACIATYYLTTGGACTATNQINNCAFYESANLCSECTSNYILGENRNSCNFVNLNSGCSRYQNYSCNSCNASAISNKNAFLIKTFEVDAAASVKNVVTKLALGRTDNLVQSVCLTKTVSNCLIFAAYNKCYTCNDGFYLDTDFTCTAYSTEDLSGCRLFSNATTCTTCYNGYYLDSSTCTMSTTVQNCEVYSASTDACEGCVASHYLSTGQCLARQNTDNNCERYNPTEDKCAKCDDNYLLYNNNLNCALLENNCLNYGVYDPAGVNTTCIYCGGNYYVSGGACVQGSDPNCGTVLDDADTCVQCVDNFAFNQSGLCTPVEFDIPNCDLYMNSLPTRCQTCSNNAKKFSMVNVCTAIAVIPNCKTFSDAETCEVCNDGFELVTNACTEIPASEHCLNKDEGVCIKCLDNYELIQDACIKVPDIFLANCAIQDSSSRGVNYECSACDSGYLPLTGVTEVCLKADEQAFTKIDNCLKYYKDAGDSYKCQLCNVNYALSTDSTECFETCPAGQVKYLGGLDIQGESVSVAFYARCVDLNTLIDLPNGCEVASHNLKGNGNVCLKCGTGFIPIENCSMNNTFFNVDFLGSVKEGQAFSTVSCEAMPVGTVDFLPSSAEPATECKHYRPDGGKYYCTQCIFGYTGTVVEDNDGKPYIDCSEQVTGCELTKILSSGFVDDSWLNDMYGFSLTYNFTCHVCTSNDEIPFIHMSNTGRLKAYELNAADNIPSTAASKTGQMTVCRAPTAAGLNVDAPDFTSFVGNCALGLIVVDIEKDVTTGYSSARCLACKDGYKKVLDASGYYIESCEAITNCTPNPTSGWVEGCRTCDTTHVKTVDANNVVNPNDCSTQVTVAAAKKCRIYNSTDSTCAVCERGYILDEDGECILLNIPKCLGYVHPSDIYTKIAGVDAAGAAITLTNYSYALYIGFTTFECYVCDDEYIAVAVSTPRPICAQYNAIATAASTYLIENCDKYGIDGTNYICGVCKAGFIVSKDGETCFAEASVSNCDIANNTGADCYQCKPEYQNVSSVCLERNIDNCYYYFGVGGVLTCMACNEGFFLFDPITCIEGEVENCKNLSNPVTCTACKSGFYLAFNTCLPMPGYIHCKNADLTLGGTNEFECRSCEDDYFLETVTTSSDHPVCLDGYDSNCTNYDDSFICTSCPSNFYLDNDICNTYTPITGCTTYNASEDSCSACGSRQYLDTNACVDVDDSIPFCDKYFDDDTCASCTRNHYLDNGFCLSINTKIDDCLFYKNNTECSICEFGYLLVANTCKLITAANCASYSAPNVCSSCPPSYVYKITGSGSTYKKECELVTIQDCAEVNSTTGNCKACQKGFIPSGKTCVVPTPVIANCAVQATATSCTVCDVGFIRSNGSAACVQVQAVTDLETNCNDLRRTTSPVCSACKTGYIFSGSTCVLFKGTIANCAYGNPSDTSVCYMCAKGYFMTPTGLCISNISGLEGAEFDDADEGASIYSALGLIMTLLLALMM